MRSEGGMTISPVALSAAEAAKLVKPPISPRILISAAKAGQIPARQIGRRYFFNREAIEQWMKGPAERPSPISSSPRSPARFRRGRGLLPR